MKVPTIFQKSDRPGFFANIDRGGKIQRVRLGNTLAEATIALAAELAKLDPAAPVPAPVAGVLTLAGLLDRWLAYIKLSKSDATHRSYSRYAAAWKALYGELPAASITAEHVSNLLREKFTTKQDGKPMSESCRWQMEKVALGSFKWAMKPKQALIAKNALEGYDRETNCGKRDAWIDETQYAKLMKKCTDSDIQDFLEVLWRTGARPFELYQCDARHYDRANSRLVLSRKAGDNVKAKPKEKNAVRYIYLDDVANAIVARLAMRGGALFTNRIGERWTVATCSRRLSRMVELSGVKAQPSGDAVTQYVFRHSFATRMSKVLPIDRLAKLMGHKDTRMLVTLYDHSGDDAEHMLGLLKRAG